MVEEVFSEKRTLSKSDNEELAIQRHESTEFQAKRYKSLDFRIKHRVYYVSSTVAKTNTKLIGQDIS